jgi:hypothetical protein
MFMSAWWKMNLPPTALPFALNSFTWMADTYRSSVSPTGMGSMAPHQSGAPAFIDSVGVDTMRSGVPTYFFSS